MWSGIALLYFGCLLFGFIFALIGAIFGEFGGHADVDAGGHEIDFGGHDVDFGGDVDVSHEFAADVHGGLDHDLGASALNTITISTFIGFFGLSGLFAVWALKLGTAASLAFALPTAVVIAAAQFYLYVKIFVKAQGSSEATLADTLGCEAEVITPIPNNRVGEIAYVIKGSRYTAPAASADDEDIPRGTRVHVVNIRGTTFVVRPL